MDLRTYRQSDLTPDLLAAIAEVRDRVWPPETDGGHGLPTTKEADCPKLLRHLAFLDGRLAAHAAGFSRTIIHQRGQTEVLALASVFSDPNLRTRGLGKAVVRAALERVDNGEFTASLFQSPVPDFYRRLGCRTLTGYRWVNRLDPVDPERHPFWNDDVMVYPASRAWHGQLIDINGPAW